MRVAAEHVSRKLPVNVEAEYMLATFVARCKGRNRLPYPSGGLS